MKQSKYRKEYIENKEQKIDSFVYISLNGAGIGEIEYSRRLQIIDGWIGHQDDGKWYRIDDGLRKLLLQWIQKSDEEIQAK